MKSNLMQPGVQAALLAALLFGAATPLAKYLLAGNSPWIIAALLYLGSGLGLTLYRLIRRSPSVALPRQERPWLAGAVLMGGVLAPVLLMLGLTAMPAANVSLLLNAEGVLTALLAWFAFKENLDRRIALGMLAIVAGALLLSWPDGAASNIDSNTGSNGTWSAVWPALAVLAACLAWAIDNNLTRKVSLSDASWIAAVKGLSAGTTNLLLALAAGGKLPDLPLIGAAMLLGLLAYGVSLALFVVALRHLGTARTGAYFSIAPFLGALLALAGGESLTWPLTVSGALMALGIWLHLTERHEHAHTHEELDHEHEHVHDAHHLHEHAYPVAPGTRHRHHHHHARIEHTHAHFPDSHHRHQH